MTNLEELLDRQYNQGSRVTNCVAHMSLDLTKRPDDCLLCLADLRNQLNLCVAVNKWLNEWKTDATELFIRTVGFVR